MRSALSTSLCKQAHVVACLLLLTMPLQAGVYIVGEKLEPVADLAEFPVQLRFLRGYGPPDVTMKGKPTTQRSDFLAKVQGLRAKGKLTPDEQANLGGYLLYLKQTSPRQPPYEEAVAVMEPAFRANPRHFALASNLGTAYQLTGRLDAAERCLQTAVDLAPTPLREMEQLHLRLVQRRLRRTWGVPLSLTWTSSSAEPLPRSGSPMPVATGTMATWLPVNWINCQINLQLMLLGKSNSCLSGCPMMADCTGNSLSGL